MGGKKTASILRQSHGQISRQIAAVERAVLGFQAGIVGAVGARAADDTNSAIILVARLASVWRRVGSAIPPRES
jgi:hypothetical protein